MVGDLMDAMDRKETFACDEARGYSIQKIARLNQPRQESVASFPVCARPH
jgi:hypothetical protein